MELKIICPSCNAVYRLRRAPKPDARLRCRRCQQIFIYVPPRPGRATATESSEAGAVDAAEPLDEGAGGEVGANPPDTDTDARGAEQGRPPESGAKTPRGGRSGERKPRKDRDPMIPEFEFGEEEEFTLDPENKDFDAVEASEPIRQKPEKRRPSNGRTRGSTVASDDLGQFRTLVFLLCVVVGFYAVLTTSLFARPDRAQALITQIPVVGQGIGEERLWARRVRLEGVEASTQQTKDGRPVLVITGRAVNTAPNPLQAVQLSAELLRADGKVVDEKTVFLGNMVSARVLRDLTPQEISILQQLSPPKQFAIPPGESASFAIVFFLDATRQGDSRRVEEGRYPSEFRLRVVTARRQG